RVQVTKEVLAGCESIEWQIAARSANPQKCYSSITDSGMTAIVKTKNPCTK
ncbi:hypothetical protein A2U01_0033475, partial [Trifolium medium]|nr:hypothetical protein [Trifolium medium]